MKQTNKKQTIAVYAHRGMVGSATYKWFESNGHPVMGWSRSTYTHTIDEINEQADWIFVAVPTPYVWETKEVKLNALIETLKKIKPGKKVIHKCTVPPGTTEQLQKEFPNLYLFYNPEFLSEASNERDFANPDRQIIGYTEKSYKYAMDALNILPESPYGILLKSHEAEICKFVNNFHGALMVIFANFFYDISQKFENADFEAIKKACQASKWVGSPMGRMYWDVFHGGFRGFANKCFVKDLSMLKDWCKSKNINYEILKATWNMNQDYLYNQGLNEVVAEKIPSEYTVKQAQEKANKKPIKKEYFK